MRPFNKVCFTRRRKVLIFITLRVLKIRLTQNSEQSLVPSLQRAPSNETRKQSNRRLPSIAIRRNNAIGIPKPVSLC